MFYIGIDIGGTKTAVVLGQKTGGKMIVLGKKKFPTVPGEPFETIKRMDSEISAILDEFSLKTADIGGIGISCGGPLDSQKGIILSPPNLPGWDEIYIVKHFEDKFGVKIYLQNDANACAVAEWKYGAGKGFKNVIFLTFGTGLGAGLILDGKLYSGTSDMAGEIGHLRLTPSGPAGYGKSGSAEGYCSGGGIAQIGQSMVNAELKKGNKPKLLEAAGSIKNINAKNIADLADAGDELCVKIYHKSAEMLGRTLAVLVDLLNPELIIIGSIYARSQNLLEQKARKFLDKESLVYSSRVCRIVPAGSGEAIGDLASLSIATGEF